jgi:hypothetical protein
MRKGIGKSRGHVEDGALRCCETMTAISNSCRDVWVVSSFRAGLQFNSSGLLLVGGIYKVYGLLVGDDSFDICC